MKDKAGLPAPQLKRAMMALDRPYGLLCYAGAVATRLGSGALPRVPQYSSNSGRISCRIVVAISSMDLVVVDSQRMPSRRIMASASATS
jgi:hypothetical protein